MLLSGPERANGNFVFVIEEADREILSPAAFRAIPMPLSFMACEAENPWRGHYGVQNQLRTVTLLTLQVEGKFLVAFLANHLGVFLIEPSIDSVPTIRVSHTPPFRLGLQFAWLG